MNKPLTNQTGMSPQISDESVVHNLLQRQNEITAMLVEQQTLTFFSHLHHLERFHVLTGILCSTGPLSEPLHIVWKRTQATEVIVCTCWNGTPRVSPKSLCRAVNTCLQTEAMIWQGICLKNTEYKITAAYMEKVLSWPLVKSEDALFLHECCNVMENVQYMRELNVSANMKTLI